MPDAAPTTATVTDPAATAPADAGTSAPAAVTDPAAPAAPAAPVIPAAPAVPAADPAAPAAPAGDPAAEPTTFDAPYVKGLRDEAASWRTKTRDAETARDEFATKYNDLVASLGKLGGFTPDEGGTAAPADPAEAIAAAEQRANDMAAKVADYTMRDAVRSAGEGADVPALLDSTSFLAEVGQLDHSATDYAAQVAAAVESFISANPRFASAPVVPGRSGGDTSAGEGEPGQLTDEQFETLSHKDRLQAFADGRYKP